MNELLVCRARVALSGLTVEYYRDGDLNDPAGG
jgi:hypothetical protein